MSAFKSNNHQQQNTLYEGRMGYVVHCAACKTFHIAYGTVAFDQTENSLLTLMEVLRQNYCRYNNTIDPDCRCVQIQTPFKGFRFLFSTNELREFGEMLQQAHLVYEAERIVNDQNYN
ncbi:MAG: DUF6686 family protein [Bacteroidota bacterium]